MFYSCISIFIMMGFVMQHIWMERAMFLSMGNDDVGKTLFCPATGNTEVSKIS